MEKLGPKAISMYLSIILNEKCYVMFSEQPNRGMIEK